jgi:hypothetical protein
VAVSDEQGKKSAEGSLREYLDDKLNTFKSQYDETGNPAYAWQAIWEVSTSPDTRLEHGADGDAAVVRLPQWLFRYLRYSAVEILKLHWPENIPAEGQIATKVADALGFHATPGTNPFRSVQRDDRAESLAMSVHSILLSAYPGWRENPDGVKWTWVYEEAAKLCDASAPTVRRAWLRFSEEIRSNLDWRCGDRFD